MKTFAGLVLGLFVAGCGATTAKPPQMAAPAPPPPVATPAEVDAEGEDARPAEVDAEEEEAAGVWGEPEVNCAALGLYCCWPAGAPNPR